MYFTVPLNNNTKAQQPRIRAIFQKNEIEALDLDEFLGQFQKDTLPKGEELANLMGRLTFLVEGYDDDPREVYTIDEVRTFFQTLSRKWPYWLFFCDLRAHALISITACCIKDLSCVKYKGCAATMVNVNKADFFEFIHDWLAPMAEMFEQANMPMSASLGRTAAVLDYYNSYFV